MSNVPLGGLNFSGLSISSGSGGYNSLGGQPQSMVGYNSSRKTRVIHYSRPTRRSRHSRNRLSDGLDHMDVGYDKFTVTINGDVNCILGGLGDWEIDDWMYDELGLNIGWTEY
ncbi:hypothetical protein ONS95_014190 [Cadophora gregata]|uniref:uncharacterized protein n=1 Tax=Cadophora gregata TaxID=51156 RepID=UPI0026DD6B9F|nr:uncharacterized protein ONS95_014190 [Cadophora gregata]KAK0114705.1 hypothetical protein ONS95_014190 [Cadophora gregata]